MPRETKPSLVYIVKGEGVRNNSWVLQSPLTTPKYSSPPLEQLDSVPTPFGGDLSVRIFGKGTKPLPYAEKSNPNTAVVEAQALPMASKHPSRAAPQPTPDPSPPTRTTAPPKPAVTAPAPSLSPSSKAVLPKPPNTAPRAPSRANVDPRRLRNFRNLSVRIIADPRTMPPPYFLPDPSAPSPPSHPLMLSQTTAKKASKETVQKAATPTLTTLPKPHTVSQDTTRKSSVHPKPVHTPQTPSLAVPGPSSPLKPSPGPSTNVTSPSAFGRWKPSSPVLSPSAQKSPQLPSPKRAKATTVDKSRSKPWQKSKSGKPAATDNPERKKALLDIIDKRLKVQTKQSKALPPLLPLAAAASHPSKSTPVPPKTSGAGDTGAGDTGAGAGAAITADPVSEQPSSSGTAQNASQPVQQSVVRKDPVASSAQPVQQPPQKPATARDSHATKEQVIRLRPKAPDTDPSSFQRESLTKATPTLPDLNESRVQVEQKLQQRAPAQSSKAVTVGTPSSARPHSIAREKDATTQPRVTEKPPVSSRTARKVPTEPPVEVAPSTSPQTSADDIEVGTVAHPIITKEDLIKARRLREEHGQPKGRSQEKPAHHKPLSGTDRSEKKVFTPKPQVDLRPRPQQKVVTKANVIPHSPRGSIGSLFDSDVQETMKSVIEQVVWTVQHFKRSYGISTHDEMKNNKLRILNFIQTHLDGAASGSALPSRAKRQSGHVEREAARTMHAVPKEAEAGRRTSDSRQTNFKNVKAHRMFVAWKRDMQTTDAPLAQIATEAEQLRQAVLHCNMSIIHIPANDLITRLKELGELTFTFLALKKRLPKTMSAIDLINNSRIDAKKKKREGRSLTEKKEAFHIAFDHAFNIIKCAVLWMFFLAEQVTHTWKSLIESSKGRALGFAREVFKVLIKESQQAGGPEGTDANKGVIKAVRSVKAVIGKLEEVMKELPDDGKPVSLVIQELVSKFAEICKFGEEKAETKDSTPSSAAGPGADRAPPSTVRPDSTTRKLPPAKLNGNQQARQTSRGTSAPTSSAGENTLRGGTRAQHEFAATAPTTKPVSTSKSSPAIPRRPSEPVSPRASQAVPNSRRPASTSSAARWQNTERLDLRSLMESARTVHEPKQKGGKQAGSKRKAEEDGGPSSSDSDGKPAKKRRVRFAPNLVQGAQSTPYSKEALQSLFYDGYDLLGETTQLQKEAVEERASQMSRGSVIATLGFITSYIAALKAERDGHNCQRPEWVRLPYTVAMKKDIHRFMRNGGFRGGRPQP